MRIIYSIIILLCFIVNSCTDPKEEFEFCDNFFGTNPYYYVECGYKGELYSIYKLFSQKYKLVTDEENLTGIVKISFFINCKGKVGNFSTNQFDYNYNSIKINSKIIVQLIEILKNSDEWISGKSNEGESIDCHKYLIFKIRDSRIIEILPK